MLKHSSLQHRPSVVISRVAVRSRRSTVIAILTAAMILPFCAESAQSVYVSNGPGSFDDHRKDQVFKDKPNDTDYVCASSNAAGVWTSSMGRPCDYFLWANIPSTQSIATCDTSSGTCKNQNGGIETYVVKASISGSTPTPPVVTPPTSGAGNATITWTIPTVDTDGKPIQKITGYNLYYGTSPANLATKNSLPPTPQSVTVSNLASGTYYFAMTTCVSDCSKGNESDRTNLASKNVVASTGNPPIVPPVLPPVIPPNPVVSTSGGVWAAKKGSTNLKTGLASHDDCLAYLGTQPNGKYSCLFSGETVTVGK